MSIHQADSPKVVSYEQASHLIAKARQHGLVTVLAQGVFDVIHIGHTGFLKDAKKAGDLLFVGLESDAAVKKNKGSSRPFNPIEDRLQLLADLECTDYVFSFTDDPTYGHLGQLDYNKRLEFLKPDKLALSLGDSLIDIRKENAVKMGVQPIIASGVWRSYSTTKLLEHIN